MKKTQKPIDWDSVPLGKETDKAIAERFGCSAVAVKHARDRRGIPRFVKPVGSRESFDWENAPLGEMSDKAIARKLGCSAVAVRWARQRRGIPKHTKYSDKHLKQRSLRRLTISGIYEGSSFNIAQSNSSDRMCHAENSDHHRNAHAIHKDAFLLEHHFEGQYGQATQSFCLDAAVDYLENAILLHEDRIHQLANELEDLRKLKVAIQRIQKAQAAPENSPNPEETKI